MEEISSNNQNGVETTEIPGEQVNLSKKTLALLNAEQNPSENDDIPAWQKNTMSLFYSIVGEEPPNNVTRSRSRRTKVPTRPSEAQLSAPYIEEQRPENPDYIMRISDQVFDDSPEAPEANEANGVEPISPTTSTRRRNLRTKFLNAAKLTTANIRFAKGDGRQLQDVGDGDSFTWLTSVPFLWLKRDPKGQRQDISGIVIFVISTFNLYYHLNTGIQPPVIINMLKLAITDSESDPQYNWQSIFRIELAYGDVKWVVKRTSFDFITLHVNLTRRPELSRLVPKFPSGLSSWFKTKIFHSRQDDLSHAAALERRKELEKYLINVITRLWLNLHISYELYAFLELSAISITSDMGWKGKEGYMEHKVERYKHPVCSFRLTNEKWEHRWIIVRDSSTTPADVFLIDRHFECDKVEPKGFSQMLQFHAHIELKNSSRRIEIKTDSHTSKTFMESIDIIKKASPWVKQHRHDSFAPIRENARVKWYVDGKDYFFAVSQAILAAKSEIYIEDWWLSPELYLRRPPSKNEEFRLDRLLKKKAEEGVMIYIIVYKEVTVALTLDSHHTKFYLQDLHKNIKVQRHPDHGIEGVMFWAHHEKMVVVDSRIAFIGGLDLCFGRYDTHSHELSDWPPNSDGPTIWPGQDYSNPRIKDFQNVKEYDNEIVDKSRYPRMPWHDVSIGMATRDVARHFVQRWNFIKEEKSFERETLPFLLPKGEYVNTRDESKFKGNCEVQLLRSSAVWSSGIKVESSIYSAYHHLIRNAKHFIYIENQFFVTSTEDDPNYTVKNRIGKSIVERVIKAHQDGEKFRVIVVMPLLPGFEADLNSNDAGTIRMVMHWQYVSICRGGKSVLDKIKQAGIDPENYISFFALRGYDKIKRKEYNRSASNDSIKNKQSETSDKSQPSHNHDISTDSYSDEQTKTSLRGIGGEPGMPAGMTDSDPKHTYVTEEIYIHSKLMIVDDRYVIIGSANINDRSQLGDRDSEIAILVEDKQTVPSRMNGNKYEASKFAYTLRSNLFKEFLGLIKPQDHATVTKITNWKQYEEFVPNPAAVDKGHVAINYNVKTKLEHIRGHLVTFPLHFLESENLMKSVMLGSVTPNEIFT
ncbi:34282_t:CDS:10 [Gigaspora margarita]|uniref:phospholipase D n=1 Tax=Gigaspora margarita TaxID=4874 RepID=A0ABN7U8E2_GIGMA|nr:34282_t:CDS:10 [Gigaspora margarita]